MDTSTRATSSTSNSSKKEEGTGGVRLYVGTVVHCPRLGELEVWERSVLAVSDETGTILALDALQDLVPPALQEQPADAVLDSERVGRLLPAAYALRYPRHPPVRVVRLLEAGQFLVPGLVDTHIHAPQYVFTGAGYDLPLLAWLERYTFPREAEFASVPHAQRVYRAVVERTLRCGTTTACYYATIHLEASKALADAVVSGGQRAFVGKVNMDRNSPPTYGEETQASLAATREFVAYVAGLGNDRATPCITPRFAPTCSSALMHGLAAIAQEQALPIQTHCSENVEEIAWVKDLHPDCPTYASVYASHGLLQERTILAHCVHLEPQEVELLHQTQCAVAHCPNSNFSLQSGVLRVRSLLDRGIKVGLGTDVAGGYSFSMMDAMRQCILASKVVYLQEQAACRQAQVQGTSFMTAPPVPAPPFGFKEALYLATQGGAECMGLEGRIGTFAPGKAFDALLIDLAQPGNVDLFPSANATTEERVERWVYLGDDRNVRGVWVQGRACLPKAGAVAGA